MLSNPMLGIYLEKNNSKTYALKNLYVHSTTIYNNQDMEAA